MFLFLQKCGWLQFFFSALISGVGKPTWSAAIGIVRDFWRGINLNLTRRIRSNFRSFLNVTIHHEFPTKSPGMLTHLLKLANPLSESTGSSSHLSRPSASPDFCRLLYSVDCSILSTSLFSRGTFLTSSSSGLVEDLVRKPFVGFAPKQTKESSDWHLPTPTQWMPTSCHIKKSTSGLTTSLT